MMNQIVRRLSLIVVAVAVGAFAVSAAIAYASNAAQPDPPPYPKYIATLSRPLDVDSAKALMRGLGVVPESVTFAGPGYSCGGTITSVDDVDRVAAEIAETWASQATDVTLSDEARKHAAGVAADIAKHGLRVVTIEGRGLVPTSLMQSADVDRVTQR